ncbi:uncharacterized protein LOC143623393 [Bidens hawaiensis]|uniref:uncharacterized protein LOC143623393 n=1 Tax=Bidens hawaiensis TaxID=980011 RepID=UPI004049DF99
MPLWCHIFTLTLVGATRAWFERSPEGQITGWEDLSSKFTKHFSQQRRHISDPTDILTVTRRDNETLEDFITRFNQEGLNNGGVGEELLRAAFRRNVRCDDLIQNLTGRDGMPHCWDDIMTATKRYVRIEKSLGKELMRSDARNYINKARQGKKMSSVWSRLNHETQPKDTTSYDSFKNKQKGQTHSSSRWNPLTKSAARILYTEGIQLKKPALIKPGPNTDLKSFCDYHEQHGHTTNQFSNLKDAIEEYVKNGRLEHLVKNIRGKGRRPTPRDGGRPEKKIKDLHANMISGGMKTNKRNQVNMPSGKKRATSDIMYCQCFDLLEETNKQRLTSVNAPITGFNQSVEYPLGKLTFPVTLTDGVHSRTEDVDILVMETPHPHYDVILGREAIGNFNASPSTAHEILGVPTPTRVAMIHANKECHVVEVKTPPQKMLRTDKAREVEKWVFNRKFLEQSVSIRPTLYDKAWNALKRLLISNADIFAWTPTDMTGS